MHQELKAQRTAIPFEMANSLMLLHSYILVKIQIKLNNHVKYFHHRSVNYFFRFRIVLHVYSIVLRIMLANFLHVGFGLIEIFYWSLFWLYLDIVQILTTAVVECQKAGMNNTAFNFSLILMRQEYRDQIDAKYKKKIEALVR